MVIFTNSKIILSVLLRQIVKYDDNMKIFYLLMLIIRRLNSNTNPVLGTDESWPVIPTNQLSLIVCVKPVTVVNSAMPHLWWNRFAFSNYFSLPGDDCFGCAFAIPAGADQSRIMQEQMSGAAMAMPADTNKAFKVYTVVSA